MQVPRRLPATQYGQMVSVTPGVIQGLSQPQTMRSPPGTHRIRNREMLVSLGGTAVTNVVPAQLGTIVFSASGLPVTSWLAKNMALYDTLKVHHLSLQWMTILPTTAGGGVVLYLDSDAKDAAPASYIAASGNMGAVSGAIYQPFATTVAKSQLDRLPSYACSPGSALDNDIFGSVAFATTPVSVTIAAGAVIFGYIWMEYDVTLSNPTNS
jgi:hypothetical protein